MPVGDQLPAGHRTGRVRHEHESREARPKHTMQEVSDYEDNWQPNAKQPEDSEDNDAAGFELPRSFMPKVRR